MRLCERTEVVELALPADERGELGGQVRAMPPDRSEGWELRCQARAGKLVDVRRLVEVLEPKLPQVAQPQVGRQEVADHRRQRPRNQDLAAMPGCGDASGAVDLQAGITAVAASRFADVEANSHAEIRRMRPFGQRPLAFRGGLQRSERAVEHDEE